MKDNPAREALRNLPQVEEVLRAPQVKAMEPLLPHAALVECVRAAVDAERREILDGARTAPHTDAISDDACARALATLRPSLRRVVNATGVIVHTNLGRSVLADEAVRAVSDVARSYSTLEYNTDAMARGSRHAHVERLICTLTGAEAAIAVNNNAAAVMMVLREFAAGHEAVVSRGELVEIGGSFRIPDIMALSDARMVEIGTTNKTHPADYARAITPATAMLLKVHPSNYRMIGFTESVPRAELRRIADAENEARRQAGASDAGTVLVYEDQGSGAFMRLEASGDYAEPTVAESLKAGCDLVSFSGDKLLGGPQAGIIVGAKPLIDRLKKNPLARALRLDKMTLAALESTLRIYLDPERAMREIPTLRMLTEPVEDVRRRAEALARAVREASGAHAEVDVVEETARAGGGAMPMCDIPTFCARISFKSGCAQDCERSLVTRRGVPVVGRIKKEAVLLDAKTLLEGDIEVIAQAVREYFESVEATAAAAGGAAQGKKAEPARTNRTGKGGRA